MRRLPPIAIGLGLAGLIPFIALGLLALSTADEVVSQRYLLALVGYGAVGLAFLGGVHWGFVLHPSALPEGMDASARRDSTRLGLGVLPSLLGFAALLTPELSVPEVGLAVLIVGYLATVITEAQLRRRDLVPSGYMVLRWVLSIVVVVVLVVVLALRLIGAKIFF
jgi:uncharacterized membrane protein YidH (DUF202 family)